MTAPPDRFDKDQREHAYFGFTSSQFCHDVQEMISNQIKAIVKSCGELLLEKLPETSPSLIDTHMQEVLNIYLSKLEKPMEKFEKVAEEIFELPSNVVIPGELAEEISNETLQQLKNELDEAEMGYLQEVQLNLQLQSRIEQLKQLSEKVNEEKKNEDGITSLLQALRMNELCLIKD